MSLPSDIVQVVLASPIADRPANVDRPGKVAYLIECRCVIGNLALVANALDEDVIRDARRPISRDVILEWRWAERPCTDTRLLDQPSGLVTGGIKNHSS